MAEIKYKKGELLFEGSITTKDNGTFIAGSVQLEKKLNQDVLIIDFDEKEYTCEANKNENENVYGGFTPSGPDFSIYPFALGQASGTLWLFTKNIGTHMVKIYTVMSDSDSNITNKLIAIRNYMDKNLLNLNWNILPQIFEDEGVELTEEAEEYLKETPWNTNWNLFKQIINTDNKTNKEPQTYTYIWTEFGEYFALEWVDPQEAGSTYEDIKNYIENGDIVKFDVTPISTQESEICIYKEEDSNGLVFQKEDDPSITYLFNHNGELHDY